MDIRKIPIEQIRFAPYNPRMIKDSEFEKLKQSITTFDYVEPIVWNSKTGHAVGGNQRLKALVELGFKEVEVVVVDLSLEKEKVLNLALNRISGTWDENKLASILDELLRLPDFDVGITGFELPEISRILDNYGGAKDADDFDFNKTLESIQEPVTKKGDLIELGAHRILCGDSANIEDLKTLMGNSKANILNTDYPYNVNYMGGQRPNPNACPKKLPRWDKIHSDNLPQKEYEDWMKKILANAKQFLVPGAAVYIWQGHRQFPPMYQMLLEFDFYVACVICWLKESANCSFSDYDFRTEQCLYGWLKGAPHYWAGKPGENNVWEIHRDLTKNYIHPTQKPVELAARALRNSSKRNDIVVDLFLGSGSTLIAAESLERCCFGIEIDPKYVDCIIRRYIAYAGKDKVSDDIRERYLTKEVAK
jgi:DNA modification methylase